MSCGPRRTEDTGLTHSQTRAARPRRPAPPHTAHGGHAASHAGPGPCSYPCPSSLLWRSHAQSPLARPWAPAQETNCGLRTQGVSPCLSRPRVCLRPRPAARPARGPRTSPEPATRVRGPAAPRCLGLVPRDEKSESCGWRQGPTARWGSVCGPQPGLLGPGPGAPSSHPSMPSSEQPSPALLAGSCSPLPPRTRTDGGGVGNWGCGEGSTSGVSGSPRSPRAAPGARPVLRTAMQAECHTGRPQGTRLRLRPPKGPSPEEFAKHEAGKPKAAGTSC